MADGAVQVSSLAEAAGAGAAAVQFHRDPVVHHAGVGHDGAAGSAVHVDVDVLALDALRQVLQEPLVAQKGAVLGVLRFVEAGRVDAGDGAGAGGDKGIPPAGL